MTGATIIRRGIVAPSDHATKFILQGTGSDR